MYKNFFYIAIATLLAFIIWIGIEPIELKIALGIIALTLLPKIRKKLYTVPLVLRKSKAAFLASFLLLSLLLLLNLPTWLTGFSMSFVDFTFTIFLFLSFLLGTVVYGIPVSLFSDFVTAKIKGFRFFLAFIIHIGFGLGSFFFLGPLMIVATLLALLFFLIDEVLRKRELTYSGM